MAKKLTYDRLTPEEKAKFNELLNAATRAQDRAESQGKALERASRGTLSNPVPSGGFWKALKIIVGLEIDEGKAYFSSLTSLTNLVNELKLKYGCDQVDLPKPFSGYEY